MFTWVYLTCFEELEPAQLTETHIARMEHIAFDAEMCKYILDSIAKDKQLSLKYLTQLAYTKLINRDTAIDGPEVDLIELGNIIMDHGELMQATKGPLMQDYLNALYFRVIIPYPSLFFFRSRHLLDTLNLLATDPMLSKEKAFWQKSEDLILRSKNQLSVEQVARVVSIYSKVDISQVFWSDMEQLILSKSADFRGKKHLLLQILRGFSHRSNETFWKVFSANIAQIAD